MKIQDNIDFIIGSVGLIIGAIGLVIGLIQTKKLRKIEKQKQDARWIMIRDLLIIIQWTQWSNLDKKNRWNPVLNKVNIKVVSMYRKILKQIIIEESNFNERIIQDWIELDKISDRQQKKEAQKYLPTKKKYILGLEYYSSKEICLNNNNNVPSKKYGEFKLKEKME